MSLADYIEARNALIMEWAHEEGVGLLVVEYMSIRAPCDLVDHLENLIALHVPMPHRTAPHINRHLLLYRMISSCTVQICPIYLNKISTIVETPGGSRSAAYHTQGAEIVGSPTNTELDVEVTPYRLFIGIPRLKNQAANSASTSSGASATPAP
jgi:hypothetical protein